MGFIEDYLRETREFESCTAFWKWSAYSIISAILRDNCYFLMKGSKTYANIYVLFLADSAIDRKGLPVDTATSLLRVVKNTKVIAGRESMQGVLQDLSQSETDEKTGKVMRGGSAILHARELTAGIIGNADAVKILTDIYDPQEKYDITLKSQAKATISNLVFSMFSASNKDLLLDLFDKTAIKGGLLGRTFLIVPDEIRPGNSLITHKEEEEINSIKTNKILIDSLKQIAKLNGKIRFSEPAVKTYDEWYRPFRDSMAARKDKTGLLGRIHVSILKVAAILAANELSMMIESKHINQAMNDCLVLVKNYTQLTGSAGKSTTKDAATILMSELIKHGTIGKNQLLADHWEDLDLDLLDQAATKLEAASIIETTIFKNELTFQLTPKGIKMMAMDYAGEAKNGNK